MKYAIIHSSLFMLFPYELGLLLHKTRMSSKSGNFSCIDVHSLLRFLNAMEYININYEDETLILLLDGAKIANIYII